MSTATSKPTAAALAAKQAMESQLIEVFAAGTRPSEQGDVFTITRDDLLKTAAAYDPKLHEAPFTIGHPETSDPAYGYALKFAVSDDGKLLARAHQVVPEYALQATDGGQLKKRSIEFYHPQDPVNPKPGIWYPRHIGALGGQPPAVKGLKDIPRIPPLSARTTTPTAARFAEAPTRRVSFAEASSTATAPRSTTMTEEEIAALKAQAAADKKKAEDAEAARIKAEADAKAARDANAAVLKAQAESRHAEHVSFAEGMCGKGQTGARISPADMPKLVAVLDALGDAATIKRVSFAEGDKRVEFDAVKFVRDAFGALPVRVSFGEYKPQGTPAASFSNGDPGGDVASLSDAELDTRIKQHQATHK
ncbi:hypothetical protein VITFI_CDS0631 [Vitreoscilla filiformis]|uniref:Uncharacterized protein n=1 Tax=Vitreoscilla filiformis TaxID=63 RepID=A0A221KC41_VITFI|nr:hypothetical protein [Vitreoscilla filiformis]ASM76410.1 hypothetical protein VITFI_CDS0631 [Vitreoscilla filiformis]